MNQNKHQIFLGQPLQRGLLFGGFPLLALFGAGAIGARDTGELKAKTDSDLLMQLERMINPRSNPNSGLQFYRDVREGGFDPKAFTDRLNLDEAGKSWINELAQQAQTEGRPQDIGGWWVAHKIIMGFRHSCVQEEARRYLDFLIEVCYLDRDFIRRCNESKESLSEDASAFLRNWLLVEGLDLTQPTTEEGFRFLIAVVLHLAALYEKLKAIQLSKDLQTSIFPRFLPSINKKGKLTRSTKRLFSCTRDAIFKNDKNKGTWDDLYDTITDNLKKNDKEIDHDSVRKQISRWCGKSLSGPYITIDGYMEYFMPRAPEIDTQGREYLATEALALVRIFERVQREAQKAGLSDELIVSEFAKYPQYVELVEDATLCFCRVGNCVPEKTQPA